MMHKIFLLIMLTFALAIAGCEDPYNPEPVTAPNNYLVVEGTISPGRVLIRLSRSRNLAQGDTQIVESAAEVWVESENNDRFFLLEMAPGRYENPDLPLDLQQKYRLHIFTYNGKEYASDYVSVKNAPPIDDITWESKPEGVQLYVSTHDPANRSWYYRWEFDETWMFHSAFETGLKMENGEVVPRYSDEQVYRCWKSEKSTTINAATSALLSEDRIYKYPLFFINLGTNRLQIRYSIEVTQYVLDEQGFNYWENIKKISENTGTLFDPQPSQIKGNIRNVDDEGEIVIGYVSAGSTSSKRIFIDSKDLPASYQKKMITGYEQCILNKYKPGSPPLGTFYLPVDYVSDGPNAVLVFSTRACVDCTVRGTTVKPDFWQ